MRIATEQDKERILRYLQTNVQECLYLYMDIMNYGIASDNMKVWLAEEKGELSLVAMKYYDSYQIYSHKMDGDLNDLCQLLQTFPASMISGRKDLIECLSERLQGYEAVYGAVFQISMCKDIKRNDYMIMRAEEKDTLDIARFLCSDNGFSVHYTVEGLSAQLADRIRTGTGRSYIIRNENEKVIAHTATFAETEHIAVISGAMVDPAYRKTDMYMELGDYMTYSLGKENKRMYAFTTNKKVLYVFKHIYTECGEYGNLVKLDC